MSNDVEVPGPTALKVTPKQQQFESVLSPQKKNVVSRPEREAKISSYKFFLEIWKCSSVAGEKGLISWDDFSWK